MTRELQIYSFHWSPGGEMVRYTDRAGRDHHLPLSVALRHCENELKGHKMADMEAFKEAHGRYLMELELGRPLPFQGPIHKL